MSNTTSAQHPPVVLRSSYQLVRTLLAIAVIAIIGLTLAVVVLAVNTSATTPASNAGHVTTSANSNNASAELGAKLDHSGRKSRLRNR